MFNPDRKLLIHFLTLTEEESSIEKNPGTLWEEHLHPSGTQKFLFSYFCPFLGNINSLQTKNVWVFGFVLLLWFKLMVQTEGMTVFSSKSLTP